LLVQRLRLVNWCSWELWYRGNPETSLNDQAPITGNKQSSWDLIKRIGLPQNCYLIQSGASIGLSSSESATL